MFLGAPSTVETPDEGSPVTAEVAHEGKEG